MKTTPPSIIAPSILAANIAKLSDEIESLEKTGAEWLHVDVMDGTFVPPITFGDNVVRALKKITSLFLDVHLMVDHPETHFELFKEAGSDRLIIHQEVSADLAKSLTTIRSLGMKNGVAINPGTSVDTILPILEHCDLVLVMTVNPGWGGQRFMETCLPKIEKVRNEIDKRGLSTLVEVDGGINQETAKRCRDVGASVFVAGTYILGASDRKVAVDSLRG